MEKRTDVASRVIRASEAAIYRALLDAEARRVWLPPKGMTGRFERFDPRAGGGYRMVLTYANPTEATGKSSDNSDVVQARFLELVPNKRVVESIDFESEDVAFAGTMTMTWVLTPAAGGAEGRVTAADVPIGISEEDHQAGMRSSLENLAAFVE
ncbi:MAG: SRPBCC family protein [Dehalococcoidia bacterium]